MPIPGRMPTKDMCARALASLRLSALPSCRAPLSPLGSRASRLCGQRLRAGRGCSPPPRHVADGHPARHRARSRRTGGRGLAHEGGLRARRALRERLGQSSKGPVSQASAQVAPQTAGRLALSGEHPSVLPGQADRDEMATTDAARLSAILSAKEQGARCRATASSTPRCSGSWAPQRRCTWFVSRQILHERGNREYQGTRLDTAHSA